jgi:hypothetical protein
MKKVTKIAVLPLAKIQAVITGILYLVIGAVVNIIGMGKPDVVSEFGLPPGIIGVLGFAVTGIVLGFVLGALVAWIYNTIAPKVGPIEIELK